MTWPRVPLGQIAEIERNGIEPSEIETGTLYVGLENIRSGGGFDGVRAVDAGELASNKFAFDTRHLLYGKLRPYLAKIARPSFAGICSTDIVPVLPGPTVDRDFLARFLLLPESVASANARATGANLPRLSPTALAELRVPLPPLAEQRRIADILDRADAMRAKRRQAIALLDALPQALFSEMFGDPLLNCRAMPLERLSRLGTLDRGVSKHRPRNAPELLGGPYPLVQTGDVANSGGYIRRWQATYSEVGLRQSRLWPAGTLCITIAANIARAGILTFQACFPDSVVGFRSDPATVEFVRVWLLFLQKSLEDAAPESAQKNINLDLLRNLRVPVPSLEERQEFARRVEAVGSLEAAHRASLAEMEALFASLQHRAFRGEL